MSVSTIVGHVRSRAPLALAALLLLSGAARGEPRAAAGPIRFGRPPARVWDAAPADAVGEAVTGTASVPTFSDSFTFDGTTYPYTIVGTNPNLGPRRTVVPTIIVPLRLVFPDGTRLAPQRTTSQLRRSPIFRRAAFASGTTQYGDAVQRAEFWAFTQANNYHVLLGHPRVTPVQTFRVPSGVIAPGGVAAVMPEALLQQIVQAVINGLHLPPTRLIVFWSYNVALSPPSGGGVILGEHSAGTNSTQSRVWTWAWASWITPDTFGPGVEDVAPISHEIAEWYNDPFVSNTVPAWENPPSYPCNDVLEVGDPLVGTTFVVDGYHLQDEAFVSWFARQSPSMGIGGMYSLLGTLTAPPPVCTP
jgi:hypothetical protein